MICCCKNYLEEAPGQYPTLKPGKRAEELADPSVTVSVQRRKIDKPKPITAGPARGADGDLYQRLRSLRTQVARQEGLAALYGLLGQDTARDGPSASCG